MKKKRNQRKRYFNFRSPCPRRKHTSGRGDWLCIHNSEDSNYSFNRGSEEDKLTFEFDGETIKASEVITKGSSVIRLGDFVLVSPDEAGRKADATLGYNLLINVGKVIDIHHESQEVTLHWFFSKAWNGRWTAWLRTEKDRYNERYTEVIPISSLLEEDDHVIRVNMTKSGASHVMSRESQLCVERLLQSEQESDGGVDLSYDEDDSE